MKVLSGAQKGKSLHGTAKGLRPTRAVVRQAIFNILQDKVIMSSVLDVFAGTGALGIEALCRGAQQAFFVENHTRLLVDNISRLALENRSRVYALDFRRALKKLKGLRFDLIFLDPPYGKRFLLPAIRLIDQCRLLKSDGLVVVERSRRDQLTLTDSFRILKEKKYGDTIISFISHVSDG